MPLTLVYIYVGSVGVCTQHYILWAQMRNPTLVYIYVRSREMCTQYYSCHCHILLCTL